MPVAILKLARGRVVFALGWESGKEAGGWESYIDILV